MKILYKALSISGILLSLLALSGCNTNLLNNGENSSKVPTMQGTSSGNPGNGIVSFSVVFNTVLKDNCLSCHNQNSAAGNVRYDNYQATIQHGSLSTLQASYAKYLEPSSKCNKISIGNMDLVRNWIENGAIN